MRRTHGESNTPLYNTWANMKKRCTNPRHPDFSNYGGRGIHVHDEWVRSYPAFATYVREHLGERPEGGSLDRIDNEGHYEPENIRWSTMREQSFNRRPPTWHLNKPHWQEGERNSNARLNEQAVAVIRWLGDRRKVTQTKLAWAYGISQTAVSLILRRRCWAHVSEANQPSKVA